MSTIVFAKIPPELDKRLNKRARKEMSSRSHITRKALDDYLRRKEEEEKIKKEEV